MSAPTSKEARALMRSLTRGVSGSRGASYLHVGHQKWLAVQDELLAEIAEDGHAEARFVRGAYGAGKSHFLAVVQDRARLANWLTCHVECRADGVQLDRFETLYPQVAAKLKGPPATDKSPPMDPLADLLARWVAKLKAQVRINDAVVARPFEADRRIWGLLQEGLALCALDSDFVHAMLVAARAAVGGDLESCAAIVRWLRGGTSVSVPGHYIVAPGQQRGAVTLKPIGVGNARGIFRGLLWLVTAAGYEGLLLCIDEVEELAKLGSQRRRDQALQTLREFVDHCGGEGDFQRLCLFLAATPEMFEGPEWFPRYEALSTRLHSVGTGPNWRGPVIDLERTALDDAELATMAERIRDVFVIGYGEDFKAVDLAPFIDEVVVSSFRVAKPRLLARVIVTALYASRDHQVVDAATVVSDAAIALADEAA